VRVQHPKQVLYSHLVDFTGCPRARRFNARLVHEDVVGKRPLQTFSSFERRLDHRLGRRRRRIRTRPAHATSFNPQWSKEVPQDLVPVHIAVQQPQAVIAHVHVTASAPTLFVGTPTTVTLLLPQQKSSTTIRTSVPTGLPVRTASPRSPKDSKRVASSRALATS
jgi:hypothetical protein